MSEIIKDTIKSKVQSFPLSDKFKLDQTIEVTSKVVQSVIDDLEKLKNTVFIMQEAMLRMEDHILKPKPKTRAKKGEKSANTRRVSKKD
jgi:hypothetical protein